MAKRGLGKGIGALFGNDIEETDIVAQDIHQINENDKEKVTSLKLAQIEPNKEQPRKNFDEEKLQQLADSIKQHGVIQPIIVKDLNNGYYQIVAGERRWRASRIAGITEIPAIIRTYDELATMQIALIENLQREDLNPIEEALSYKALLDDFALTQEKVSEQVGKPQRNRKYNPAALASKTNTKAAGGGCNFRRTCAGNSICYQRGGQTAISRKDYRKWTQCTAGGTACQSIERAKAGKRTYTATDFRV